MASLSLPSPGTEYGPCVPACEHRDCAATRAMAESICRLCNGPIGYGRPCYGDEKAPGGFVHSVCLHEEIDRERAAPAVQPATAWADHMPDLRALEWIYEEGWDPDETGENPYRTVFAFDPSHPDGRVPILDLDDGVSAEVGRFVAALPALHRIARDLWAALDEQRSRDARVMSPKLRALQDQLGAVIRRAEGQEE